MSPIAAVRGSGLKLFDIFGIEIRLDFSVAIIFGLIVYSLAGGLFPQWHPEWTALTAWSTALVAGVLFFASLLAHELSHSLVARRFGIRVPRITLFIFGGMAEIESEAETPAAELTIAIAGPLMSAALGVLFSAAASGAVEADVLARMIEDPEGAMAELSPTITACVWLGSVNMMLAIFNMIPGFPLDGGRVFRALIWRVTGDQLKATRWASTTGKWFGWAIMGMGLWNLLVLKSFGGLWLMLIGWFLSHLATASYTQTLTQRTLSALRVKDVMRTRFDNVPASTSIEDFIDQFLLRSTQILWPVESPAGIVGAVSLDDVAAIPVRERGDRTVHEVMLPIDQLRVLDGNALASDALTALAQAGDRPVPVVSDQRIVGLIRGSDILKWVMLHQEA
ncbi:MAG: site-2 protease family protein [Gammaproteobacteria bacterium]|nr:site-2 protease family protein [Gammaproteobacteria bacterium]